MERNRGDCHIAIAIWKNEQQLFRIEITLQEAIEKSPIFLSQYWKN